MTIEKLRELNPTLPLYTTSNPAFGAYGAKIADIDTSEILRVAQEIPMPEAGSSYVPALAEFEALPIMAEITDKCFGELPTQVGYCYGTNNLLNAWEWHTSSEINIAITDLVLLLARREELVDGRIDSAKAKAFYIQKGEIIEVFATSLHFCPCQVEESGFGCVVALPRGTNVPLDGDAKSPLLFRKNKWLVAHDENTGLIEKGVVPGIGGENIAIRF